MKGSVTQQINWPDGMVGSEAQKNSCAHNNSIVLSFPVVESVFIRAEKPVISRKYIKPGTPGSSLFFWGGYL